MINKDVLGYNKEQTDSYADICTLFSTEIERALPDSENKVWHGSPVWFLDGNPITGYAVLKNSVQLLFWSGQSFDEPGLHNEGSFKAAEARYTEVTQINIDDLRRWLEKSAKIQWDYKNIVKRRGELERLK